MTLCDKLNQYCDYIGSPYKGSTTISWKGCALPASLLSILKVANGFVLKKSLFRFFGISSPIGELDILHWNRSDWVIEYGSLAEQLLFFAEDAFGDQYALRFKEKENPRLVKFWCEGGETTTIGCDDIERWLTEQVLVERPCIVDSKLTKEALLSGMTPSLSEHWSFSLPLIVGGEARIENLEVIDRHLHLNLLGQISLKNLSLPEGGHISRFTED